MDLYMPLHPIDMRKQWHFNFLLFCGTAAILTLFVYAFYHATGSAGSVKQSAIRAEAGMMRTRSVARQALSYCRQHQFNTSFCFLLDMHLPSGQNRFFVYDLQADTLIAAALVAHGSCGHRFSSEAAFSNRPGCGCSAKGRYKIGYKYKGSFGTAYKLYGLDSTNSRAFERNIVLHSYYMVPDKEVYPLPICNSLGCAMVSTAFLKRLIPRLDASPRPVLLWMYE